MRFIQTSGAQIFCNELYTLPRFSVRHAISFMIFFDNLTKLLDDSHNLLMDTTTSSTLFRTLAPHCLCHQKSNQVSRNNSRSIDDRTQQYVPSVLFDLESKAVHGSELEILSRDNHFRRQKSNLVSL